MSAESLSLSGDVGSMGACIVCILKTSTPPAEKSAETHLGMRNAGTHKSKMGLGS